MTITTRLLVTSFELRYRQGKADVLSIHGERQTRRPDEDADETLLIDEIVLFGQRAHALYAELSQVLEGRRHLLDPDAVSWAGAGVCVEATGEVRRNARRVVPTDWVKAETARVLPIDAEAPDEIAAFRRTVYRAIELAVMSGDGHKSSEGYLTVGWEYPPIFDDNQRPRAHVHLYAYVLGPGRGKDWTAESLPEVMGMVVADLTRWLKEDGLANLDAALYHGAEPVWADPDDGDQPGETADAA